MNPTEIMQVLKRKNQQRTEKNEEYKELSQKRAEAERQWKVAYAHYMFRLKQEGCAVTMLKDLCAGAAHVADLKFQFEVSLAIEKASLESMKDVREAIGSARSILTWLREELHSP